MPHYLVERTADLEHGLGLPGELHTVRRHEQFHSVNAQAGVAWILSFVTPDGKKSFCLYAAPDPAMVRQAANLNGLPVDRISEVNIQRPYAVASTRSTLLPEIEPSSNPGGKPDRP